MTARNERPAGDPVSLDTIVATATPWGRGALAVVRLSGPDAREIARSVCPGGPRWIPRRASLRRAVQADGTLLDEVVATWMPGPRSYTGFDVVELSCHGNPVVVEALVAACIARGARPARPGEFTRQAVENGRLDLVAAESVDALIRARSLAGARLAAEAAGRIEAVTTRLRERLLDLAAELEARLDHPGEDLGTWSDEAVVAALDGIAEECRGLAASWHEGRVRIEGARVGLIGPVNAGKSSLFNGLVGQERALVSDEPGTTRDVVERAVMLDDLAVTFLDSAGERPAATALERAGQALAADLLADVELVLLVLAGHRPVGALERGLVDRLGSRPHIVVATHADVVRESAGDGTGDGAGDGAVAPIPDDEMPEDDPRRRALWVSNTTGEGIDALRAAIRAALVDRPAAAPAAVLVSHRQQGLMRSIADCCEEARTALTGLAGPAVAAEALTRALAALAELTGEDAREAVLDRMFARFCIGK
ncbi:MAG: GTP-binding protein [Deltaproteobacteria bacterium]|nr:MAG: GTP-binding protein [Deltaproteobacteria bacterium]